MLSDDDYYFFEDDYYTDNTSDNEWYDGGDLDDYAMYGMGDSDHMDYEPYRPPEQNDQQAIYKELNIPNPNNVAKNALPLIDICASKVALNFPFAYVEDRTPPIPENVQLKIISNSFPQHMEKIKRYCLLNNGSSNEFDKAIRIVKSVKDLTQIGFHLSANVECRGYREVWYGGPPGKKTPYLYVNVKFDRGKITETNCPCENNSSWCFHVIAVCLARIFLHYKCVVKPPLSDSLNNLTTYAQLRTFTQYLIAEFSDRRIVESAQNVIDRMLKPKEGDADAINETWGAPDPTAGPGLDEISQWLICEEGLKARCTTLIHNSDVTEGCWGLNVADLDNTSSVIDRWKLSQVERPVVEGYFSDLDNISGSTVYSYNHHKKTYSREKSQEITKFLKTCEELLRDDFGYSLKAVQTFTVQLMDVMVERNKRNYYRASTDRFESNFHLGCSPRPRTCWLFRDQLARLWRLLVLNPSISIKEREKIFTTLEQLQAKLHCNGEGKKQVLEWDSQKHIKHLKNFTWESLQLAEDPFKNDISEVTVSITTVIEPSNHSTKSPLNNPAEQFPYPIELTCGSFHSSVTVYCYLIEALTVYGRRERTVHLAMNVALAIVRYYSNWLEGRLRAHVQNTLPLDYEDSVRQDNATGKTNKGGKKNQKKRQSRKRGRTGAKQAEEQQNEKNDRCLNETLFDQVKGIIPITSVAYLLDILEQHQDLLAEMLKLVKLRGLGLNEEDLMECDDITSDARSLIFRLGVIGLAMPKIQAPSLQIQVEWFNWEVYVSEKVLKSSPSRGDFDFLKTLTSRMISCCEFGFSPPYALVMNLFHHSYNPDLLDTKAEDGVSVAMETLVALPLKANGVSIHRRTFLECLRRHWVKLCETVLCRISVSPTHMSRALECLFTATVMIGSTSEDVCVKVNKKVTHTVKQTRLIQNMVVEKVLANLYLAYVLVTHADKLKTTTDVTPNPALMNAKKPKTSPLRRYGVITREVEKSKTPLNEQQKLLYETAITLACRAFAVKNITFHQLQLKNHNQDYSFLEFMQWSLKWMCSLSNKIDVKAYDIILERQRLQSGPQKCFNDDEVIKICTTMLESGQKHEDCVWFRARDALLTLMRPDSEEKISDILQLCRTVEKEPSGKRVLLVPAVCKELLLYIPGSTLEARTKVEHLARAMTTMHALVKKLEGEDVVENLEGVKELFSESSSSDKPGTSDECSRRRTLDPNIQLCFDLAIETVKHIDDSDRTRGFEARRRFENICDVVAFVAKKAYKTSGEQSEDAKDNPNSNVKEHSFEEVYVSRFIEVLCTDIKDCLLLTDFFFELLSRLFGLPQSGSFGRDRVFLSDDYRLPELCESCSSLSVLLKRCITGLLESTHGEGMNTYLKETIQDNTGYLKVRAKNAKFYCGASLVSVLEVLKRLMSISKEDDFEPFSYKLSSKHPIAKAAIEELNNKSSSSPGRHDNYTFSEEQLISSLLLRRMFSPALSYFDYDSDEWRY